MKKFLLALPMVLLLCSCDELIDTLFPVDESEFPDVVFCDYVFGNYDTDGDGFLTKTERGEVIRLDVSNMEIGSLTGIKHFYNLQNLNCSYNELAGLDVSKNTALITLDCSVNLISTLDVSANTSLNDLNCLENPLVSLVLGAGQEIKNLSVPEDTEIIFN